MITQSRLKELLHYNPETGIFTRIASCRRPDLIGKKAGSIKARGYVSIMIDGHHYLAHRLAFLYMTGLMPESSDHINRVRDDNRWVNIRVATPSQNMMNRSIFKNNKSGFRGVSWKNREQKWVANIRVDGKQKQLGTFICKHEANKAFIGASKIYYREFASAELQEDKQ